MGEGEDAGKLEELLRQAGDIAVCLVLPPPPSPRPWSPPPHPPHPRAGSPLLKMRRALASPPVPLREVPSG